MHIVHARADIVATKFGIILFFSFLPHTFLRPNLRAAKGPERIGGTQTEDLVFWLALAGGVRALWVSEHPPRRMHIIQPHM